MDFTAPCCVVFFFETEIFTSHGFVPLRHKMIEAAVIGYIYSSLKADVPLEYPPSFFSNPDLSLGSLPLLQALTVFRSAAYGIYLGVQRPFYRFLELSLFYHVINKKQSATPTEILFSIWMLCRLPKLFIFAILILLVVFMTAIFYLRQISRSKALRKQFLQCKHFVIFLVCRADHKK